MEMRSRVLRGSPAMVYLIFNNYAPLRRSSVGLCKMSVFKDANYGHRENREQCLYLPEITEQDRARDSAKFKVPKGRARRAKKQRLDVNNNNDAEDVPCVPDVEYRPAKKQRLDVNNDDGKLCLYRFPDGKDTDPCCISESEAKDVNQSRVPVDIHADKSWLPYLYHHGYCTCMTCCWYYYCYCFRYSYYRGLLSNSSSPSSISYS